MKPTLELLESRTCPAPVRVNILVPNTPAFRDEIALGQHILRHLAPRAVVTVTQVKHEFEILGMAAAAGRHAEVVVMPWTINTGGKSGGGHVRDLGLFKTNYPWAKYAHPKTVYIAAAGNRDAPRSPADYIDVFAVGSTTKPSASGISGGKRIPDVTLVSSSTSEASFREAARAANMIISRHGVRMETVEYRRLRVRR